MPPGEALVGFQNVTKKFSINGAEFAAVASVDLEIRKGEFLVLVGPSGCGKSTLLNMTAGLLFPSSGSVTYAGAPVRGLNLKTGYMTQNDQLLPWRNTAGNIAVPLEIKGFSKEKTEERVRFLIDMMGLKGFERSYPSQLSGGMRKRIALARLLAYDPETLLLDEPFAALDAQLRLNMQAELLSLQRRSGKTVVFVTHDLDEAVALADRIAVFSPRPGRIHHIENSPLARDRDVFQLRREPAYHELTAKLWEMVMPSQSAAHAAA